MGDLKELLKEIKFENVNEIFNIDLIINITNFYDEIIDWLRENVYSWKIYGATIQAIPKMESTGTLSYNIAFKDDVNNITADILVKFKVFENYVIEFEYFDKYLNIHEIAHNSTMFRVLIKNEYMKKVRDNK